MHSFQTVIFSCAVGMCATHANHPVRMCLPSLLMSLSCLHPKQIPDSEHKEYALIFALLGESLQLKCSTLVLRLHDEGQRLNFSQVRFRCILLTALSFYFAPPRPSAARHFTPQRSPPHLPPHLSVCVCVCLCTHCLPSQPTELSDLCC